MRIHCDYATAFTANSNPPKISAKKTMKQFLQNKDNFCKKEFYTDVNNYINNNISKNDFLKQFMNKGYPTNLSRAEQKYINDLKMTIDLTNNIDTISEEYVKETLNKLLKTKKG